MTTDSVGMITERFKSDESFGESTDGVFPETPIQPQSSTPHLMAFYLVIEVDAMRKSLESLRYLASHDQLTGLYNRHMMGELIKARHEQGVSQKRLEELSGVKQPVIARMEKGTTSPQLSTFLKVLAPLGKTLAVVPIEN